MLQTLASRPVPVPPDSRTDEIEAVSLQDVVDFLRRNALFVSGCILSLMAIGGIYAFTATPIYTAEARLIIDTSQSRFLLSEQDPYSLAVESARVDTEVELVKSRAIAIEVINRLELVNEAEYSAEPSLFQRASLWIKATLRRVAPIEADEPNARLRRVMSIYASRLGVRRLGSSYVIEISYSSNSAERAAEITNAIAEVYIAAKVDSKAEGARRGAQWLRERLEDLGRESNMAAAAAERFKASQRIVKSDTGSSLRERQLTDTSGRALQARAETARLRSRLEAVDRMLASGELTDAVASDVEQDPVLVTLRQRMVDVRARQADILQRYGSEGAAATAVVAEMDRIRAEIQTELFGIRSVYRSDLAAAELNQTRADGSLETMIDSAAEQSGQYVQLAELESRAATFRRMYETMLQQFTQTVQRQSFPVSDARFVTPAVAPFVPSEPRTTMIVALSGVLGALTGLGAALGRTALTARVATGRQIEALTGAPCLAALPRLSWQTRLRARFLRDRRLGPRDLAVAIAAPHSQLGYIMNSIKTSLDVAFGHEHPVIVGVASVGCDPKRARLSGNLAMLYAAEGRSTLLVDADHRMLTLTRSCQGQPVQAEDPIDAPERNRTDADPAGPKSGTGALTPAVPPCWRVLALQEGLRFASVASFDDASPHHALRLLRDGVGEARWRYDVVVVDLPSMRSSNDARALSSMFDAMVLSCEHMKTPASELRRAVAAFGIGATRLLGIVIDGAPRAKNHG